MPHTLARSDAPRQGSRLALIACPPLQVPKSNEKVAEIDEHIGCAMSGLTADARTLVDHGRNATQVCFPMSEPGAPKHHLK